MHEPTLDDFVVVPVPSPAEERFVIAETHGMLLHFVRSFAQTSTTEERVAAMLEHFSTRRSLSEAEVRAELVNRGLPATEVDAWIARARRTREMLTQIGSDAFVFERITRTGYCNEDGQEVIRKTTRSGPQNQRVFVMRCRVCGHEYGAYGCDTDIRRCPKCQDGLPGLSVTDVPER